MTPSADLDMEEDEEYEWMGACQVLMGGDANH
jgi:hypothetical protein